MKSLDGFLSQIFISLENFLQKTTRLNIFEALIFNYKIKVNSADQFAPQFIEFVVDFCNELQVILGENVARETDQIIASGEKQDIFCELQTENGGFEVADFTSSLASVQDQSSKEIWQEKEAENNTIREIEDKPELSLIQDKDKENVIHTCSFCNRKYRTSEKLLKHNCKSAPVREEKYEESADNPDPVQTEQLSLSQVPNLNSVFVCAVCFCAFSQKELFDQHTHTDNSQDKELVTDIAQLKNHRKFSCGVCCEVYRSLARISYHVARCHSGPYLCELCPHIAATKRLLNHHKKKNHKGVECFFCTECGLGFKLRTSLQKHLVKHHERKQNHFVCQEQNCGQLFTKSIYLTNHRISVHGAEKKFLCQVCGHKFMTQDSLSSHLERSHNNTKRFQCKYCDKLFSAKEKLTFHIRTHTGERPFACDRANCQKSFISKAKLMDHLQRHCGERRHRCSVCGKQYANKPDLKSHIRKIHPQEDEPSETTDLAVATEVFHQGIELYPSQVIFSSPNNNNQLFNNVQFFQEPVHVVRTVTVPVITAFDSVIGM